MNLRRFLLLAVVATATAAADRASAQCGFGAGYGFGAWDVGRLYSVLADNVPYHAAFPPVYYSYPVPRTYGYSPFAYPPGVMTPEVDLSQPQVIENPYYQDASPEEVAPPAEPASADETTSTAAPRGPLVIVNPFIADGKLAAAE